MDEISDRRIIYFDDEAHLVRRLGAAMVVLWKDFDSATHEMIIERAERVLDKDEVDEFKNDLMVLIGHHDRALEAAA